MKISLFMLLVFVTTVSAESRAQRITLSMKNAKIDRVLAEIMKQSEYRFLYTSEVLKLTKPINVQIKDADILEALDKIAKEGNLEYRLIAGTATISVRAKRPVNDRRLPDQESKQELQELKVSGVVKDANGNLLSQASIFVKGNPDNGTNTDANGSFSLVVPRGSVLVVSYIGYKTVELTATDSEVLEVILEDEESELEEVVVTALGISRERKSLSYSVTEVGGESFTKARENNLGNALSGKIAGVNATSSASGPAGSSRVIIRGNGSLGGNNQPLYIVNGVPINTANQGSPGTYGGRDMGDGLLSINPDDIESISVLKGGTAAALYGSRAANGVILITTKSGRAQQGIGIEFNSTYTMEDPLSFPNWQYEYGSGTRGLKPTTQGEAVANGRMSWGARLDGSMVVQPDGEERPYSAKKDNIKNFYNVGNTFSNTLALNGGSEAVNFRFSVSNLDNAGIVPNSKLNRKTFNLSANANLSDKILFDGKAQYNTEKTSNRTAIADFTKNPNAAVQLIGTNIDVRTLAPGYDERDYEVLWSDYEYVANPYFAINKVKNDDERQRFIGSFSTRYNITDFLYARAQIGVDYSDIDRMDLTPTGTLYNTRGNMTVNRTSLYETNTEAIIGFEKQVGIFSINAIGGGNQMYNNMKSRGLSSGNFNVPFNYFISNGSTQNFSDSFNEWAINSLFGSVDVGFNSYLYLNVTGRQDWFSTLSEESNSLFYPSVGMSLVFSDLLKTTPNWLGYGKVRASWAQVGGGAPAPYGLDLVYAAQPQSHLGQPLMSISGNTIPNSLQPYTSTTSEIGLELRTLDNRLNADIAVYERRTTNDIVTATVPTSTSYTAVSLNIGEVRNRGIELLLTGTPIQNLDALNWDVSLNLAYNDNRVEKIADQLTSLSLATSRTLNGFVYHHEGMPFGMISGYQMLRDSQGNIVYNSDSGLPIQSAFTALGRGVPPLTVGFSNEFSYKNFSFGFLLDGKFGSKLYSSTNAYGTYYGLHQRTVADGIRETGVDVSGVDTDGNPYGANISAQNYYQGLAFTITDEFVEDAGFIKLRQLTFGYALPQRLLSKTPFQHASLSIVARNLLLLYSQIDNVDPESNYSSLNGQGLENFGVPPTRSFGLNLMVRF